MSQNMLILQTSINQTEFVWRQDSVSGNRPLRNFTRLSIARHAAVEVKDCLFNYFKMSDRLKSVCKRISPIISDTWTSTWCTLCLNYLRHSFSYGDVYNSKDLLQKMHFLQSCIKDDPKSISCNNNRTFSHKKSFGFRQPWRSQSACACAQADWNLQVLQYRINSLYTMFLQHLVSWPTDDIVYGDRTRNKVGFSW